MKIEFFLLGTFYLDLIRDERIWENKGRRRRLCVIFGSLGSALSLEKKKKIFLDRI